MELVLPKLGLTMTEATVVQWLVRPGEAFEAGTTLVVIETDKITMDVEAPGAGVLEAVLVAEGENVPVGTPIASWRSTAASGAPPPAVEAAPAPAGTGSRAAGGAANSTPAPDDASRPGTRRMRPAGARVIATPLARRLAAERGVRLHNVTGTGPGGRIKAADVERAHAEIASGGMPDEGAQPVPQPEGRLEAPTPQHRTMARRMATAAGDIPHMHLIAEVSAEPLLALCETFNEPGAQPRVTLTHLLLAAVGQTLVEQPEANRVWDDGQLRRLAAPDVGLAVDTPQGLLAPVIRDAGHLGLKAVSTRAAALVERARHGQLTPDDLSGGAVTVSNLGMHDISVVIPLINPGQSAILGVGRVRPALRFDAQENAEVGKEISLVLGCDHRVFDGVSGARFLNGIRARLTNPYLLSLT